MKLNEISVERVFNLGNFESIRIGVKVSPSPVEDCMQFQLATEMLIEEINTQLVKIKEKLTKK